MENITQITVNQFNDKYGHTAYFKKNAYKIATAEDVGTFVAMVPDGYVIPYFCEWEQHQTKKELLEAEKSFSFDLVHKHEIIKG